MKISTDLADLTSSGRAFHSFGAGQGEDLSPSVALDW